MLPFSVILILILEALFAVFLLRRLGLLDSSRRVILAAVLTLGAFLLRAVFFDYETLDYQDFLTVWVDYFRTHGGFLALKYPIGNYNIPYLYFLALFSYSDIRDLYLIKLLSVFFDVLLAYAAAGLVGKLTDSKGKRFAAFFAVLCWPTVVLNGAVWAQCDSSYTALALLGLYLALDDRPCASMVCMAFSFGFKLQAVFILPVCVVLWMSGKYKLWHFLLFPLSYILLITPAVLLGRPFLDTLTLYLNQTGSIGSGLNYNSPSLFAMLPYVRNEAPVSKLAIAAAFLYMLIVLLAAWLRQERLDARCTAVFAALFAVGIPFLLPHMHDRYFFAADMLTLALGCAEPWLLPAALLTEFASLLGYHAYLKMRFLLPMRCGAWALIFTLIILFIYQNYPNRSDNHGTDRT